MARASNASARQSTRSKKATPAKRKAAGSVQRTKDAQQAPTQFLPPQVSAFLKRLAVKAAGMLPITLATLLAISVISFVPTDPSWNVASDAPVQNLLGLPGSHTADVLVQVLGCASAVPILVLFAWGLRVYRHMGLPRFLVHLALLPMATIAVAMVFATLPIPAGWPLPVGLGGVTGHTTLSWLVSMLSPLGVPSSAWVYTPLLLPFGLLLTVVAMALPVQDWLAAYQFMRRVILGAAAGSGRGTATVGRGVGRGVGRFVTALHGAHERRMAAKHGEAVDHAYYDASTHAPMVSDGAYDADVPQAAQQGVPFETDVETEVIEQDTGGILRRPKRPRADDEALEEAGQDEKKIKVAAPKVSEVKQGKRVKQEAQPQLGFDSSESTLPPLALISPPDPSKVVQHDPTTLENNARLLEEVLDDFGVQGNIVEVRPGPVVTVYELEPSKGTKTSRVIGLSDDIARSMSAISVRAAVVPGRSVIGIEIPNIERETVFLREMLASHAFENAPGALNVVLGKDIEGEPVIADLAKMPHVLVAGTTGSGKSVGVNAMILSLLYQYTPEQLRMIMVDPKILELSVYDDIPHLLTPVVTEPGKAVVALKWAVREMDDRYRQMAQLGVRNVASFNERLRDAEARGETLTREIQTGFDPETNEPIIETQELDLEPLPYIVIIVDEFADLMMMAGKDVEACVLRIAQKARAAGIHLIMATQRPSVDVVTGTIKANFPSRISYQVTSKVDSRTILGQQGAEMLLGMGDMLYMSSGGRLTRVHGPFVTDSEVEKIGDYLRASGRPNYISSVVEEDEQTGGNPDDPLFASADGGDDDLYQQAVAIVKKHKKASTSFVQRHLKIGYNRAARLIEQMEDERLISPPNHVGKREILMNTD